MKTILTAAVALTLLISAGCASHNAVLETDGKYLYRLASAKPGEVKLYVRVGSESKTNRYYMKTLESEIHTNQLPMFRSTPWPIE
jgi:uncharacterized protein YcfL